MIEILPIKILTDEDANIFGWGNVSLSKLNRVGFPIANGFVITPPHFKLEAILESFDFGVKEIFQESLTLVKKEINSVPVPEILNSEAGKHKKFFLSGQIYNSVNDLWLGLLSLWLEQIKLRLWNQGFYKGITEGLDSFAVIFANDLKEYGTAYFDSFADDVIITSKSKSNLHPEDFKKISDLVQAANKKLFIPHQYEWILDRGVKLVGVKPYTPLPVIPANEGIQLNNSASNLLDPSCTIKVFFDLSSGFAIEKNIDGIYICSEKIFDLNLPSQSFDNLVFKLVEAAMTFPQLPVFCKLADKSEGMGKVRGSLRLLHQKNLFEPLMEAISFARHKKSLLNIHIVIPFVRGVSELLQIKRELAIKKLMRKNSLQLWMEAAVPENIINMEDYLITGIDGVILNLNELIAHLNGFDPKEEDLAFYKNEVNGLLKFLEDSIRLLHKSKIPFIACGSISLNPKILEFLVEKGVFGIVAERYEAHSIKDLLHQTEKRMILRKA